MYKLARDFLHSQPFIFILECGLSDRCELSKHTVVQKNLRKVCRLKLLCSRYRGIIGYRHQSKWRFGVIGLFNSHAGPYKIFFSISSTTGENECNSGTIIFILLKHLEKHTLQKRNEHVLFSDDEGLVVQSSLTFCLSSLNFNSDTDIQREFVVSIIYTEEKSKKKRRNKEM